jgi:gamma-glutamylcyclotransferase (GGCT)/AIG2-like uncharacterized protein YtfP
MVWCPRDQGFRDCGCNSDHWDYCTKIYGKKEEKVGGKLDIMRADLRPGSGVLVETRFRHWEWGCIQEIVGHEFTVQFWPKGENSYWKKLPWEEVYPEDWTFDEIAAGVAIANVATVPAVVAPAKPSTPWLYPEPIKHVFVYGTLKKGERLHWAMKDCEFIGEDFTKLKNFKMFSVGDRFPGVTRWKGTCAIKGEVYKLPEDDTVVLKQLDRIEGVPDLFRRDDTRTLTHDLKCHMYLASLKLENAYDEQFGQHIFYDDTNKAHIWMS